MERPASGTLAPMKDLSVPVVGEASINVWHRPPGPGSETALLIHGLTGTSRWWIPVISLLPPELGLVVPDLRGRGRSSSAPGPYDIATMADDLELVIGHLGVSSPVVAGYSMGAWVAAIFSNRHPGRARRLVLIDGGLPIPVDVTLDEAEVLDSVVGPSLRRLSSSFTTKEAYFDFYRKHPAFIGWWYPGLEAVFDYEIREIDGGFAVDANGEAVIRSGRDFTFGEGIIDAARDVSVSTELLVVDHGMLGQPGGFIPVEVAREAAEANPHLRHTMVEGMNHYSLLMGSGAPRVARAITGA